MIPFHLLQRCFALGLLLAAISQVSAQTNYYGTNGTEYALTGTAPGNHVYPDLAISSTNGFMVWQDNVTDGSGWGISACHLDSTYSAASTFRVGLAALTTLAASRTASLLADPAASHHGGGDAAAVAMTSGYAHAFLIASVVVLVGGLLGLVIPPPRAAGVEATDQADVPLGVEA